MSARARVKLCSGLAKIGWLSKRKFQAIYPRIVLVKIRVGNLPISISGGISKPYCIGESKLKVNVKAGDVIVIKSYYSSLTSTSFDTVTPELTFTMEFTFSDGTKASIAGECSPIGYSKRVDYTTSRIFFDMETAQFLTPLDGQKWYYTEPLREAFGLERNNENVGSYPNCRCWSKD